MLTLRQTNTSCVVNRNTQGFNSLNKRRVGGSASQELLPLHSSELSAASVSGYSFLKLIYRANVVFALQIVVQCNTGSFSFPVKCKTKYMSILPCRALLPCAVSTGGSHPAVPGRLGALQQGKGKAVPWSGH